MQRILRTVRCIALGITAFAGTGTLAAADGDFLTFKNPPDAVSGPLSSKQLAPNLSELKVLLDAPQLWQTRLEGRSALDGPTGPAPHGLFTPRYTGSEVTLFGSGADASTSLGGVGVSLFAKPLTISGVSPVALDSSDAALDQSYNVGLSLGISRFQVGAAVSRITGTVYEFGATGLDVDMRYLGDSWQTNVALSGVSAAQNNFGTLSRGLGLIHDQSFAVQWGASYLLTPTLSLGGSLRFSGFKDGDVFGSDTMTTDSAVFLGTNFKF